MSQRQHITCEECGTHIRILSDIRYINEKPHHNKCYAKLKRRFSGDRSLCPSSMVRHSLEAEGEGQIISQYVDTPAQSTRSLSRSGNMILDPSQDSGEGSQTDPPTYDLNASIDDSISTTALSSIPSAGFQPHQLPTKAKFSLQSVMKSHVECFVCNEITDNTIPFQARLRFFMAHRVYIYHFSKVCPHHLDNDTLTETSVSLIEPCRGQITEASPLDVSRLMQAVAEESTKTFPDFSNHKELGDQRLMNLTGLRQLEFEALAEFIPDGGPNKFMALGLYLVRLRLGMTLSGLSGFFKQDRSTISRQISTIRKHLTRNFVPRYLGFKALSHEDAARDHTRVLARKLFCDNKPDAVPLVMDGTYLFLEKSNHYALRQPTYSMHKGRHLVKPMTICLTDGYILAMMGPYQAKKK